MGKRCRRATSIDARTTYAFSVGAVGLSFINFRPSDPYVVIMMRGRPQNEPISERVDFLEHGALIGPVMAAVRAKEHPGAPG